jgi:hypothetical protein
MGTRLRVGLVCVMAISALIWAHDANLKHVALEEDPVEVQSEQARLMLRDALIKDAHRVKISHPMPESTKVKTVPASAHAYSLRTPHTGAVSLRMAVEDVEILKAERRDRLEKRGEDVSDMDASGHMTLRSALEELEIIAQARRPRTKVYCTAFGYACSSPHNRHPRKHKP